MKWNELLPYKYEIMKNLEDRNYYNGRLEALNEDLAIDRYQDTQPGGGNCVSDNYKKQVQCEKMLAKLYNVANVFKDIIYKDIEVAKKLLNTLEEHNFSDAPVSNGELRNELLQSFEFLESCSEFGEMEVNESTIDMFLTAGAYICNNMVQFDDETESLYRTSEVKDSIDLIMAQFKQSKQNESAEQAAAIHRRFGK